MLGKLIENNLNWFPEKGVGFYPVKGFVYDQDYFEKYVKYSQTDIGVQLNEARLRFVRKYFLGEVLDVGIGCGQFIQAHGNALGYDVNVTAIKWLQKKKLYHDLYRHRKVDALTFWDSLEHIREPQKAIAQANKWIFVSIPIFESIEHLVNNKHYRQNEHYWYFTKSGLIRWFEENGFALRDENSIESEIGRSDISTFTFARKK